MQWDRRQHNRTQSKEQTSIDLAPSQSSCAWLGSEPSVDYTKWLWVAIKLICFQFSPTFFCGFDFLLRDQIWICGWIHCIEQFEKTFRQFAHRCNVAILPPSLSAMYCCSHPHPIAYLHSNKIESIRNWYLQIGGMAVILDVTGDQLLLVFRRRGSR